MTRRTRQLLYAGGVAVVATAGAVALHFSSWSGAQALQLEWPRASTGCVDTTLDAGLPVAHLDATTEAGPMWLATISGHATAAPLAVQIFGDDVGNQIDSFNVTAAGAWARDLPLHHGWNKLIFRVTHKGRDHWLVRWVGFDSEAPSAAGVWTPLDGGCSDAGCGVPVGAQERCPQWASNVDSGTAWYRYDGGGACRRHARRDTAYLGINAGGITDRGCGLKGWELHVRRRTTPMWVDAGADSGTTLIRKYWCQWWAGGWHGSSVAAFPDAGAVGEPVCEDSVCCAAFYVSE